MLGQPSVIARLMGMEDSVPPAPTTMIQEASSSQIIPSSSKQQQQQQSKCSPLVYHGSRRSNGYSSRRHCLSKPRRHRHRHPHEEELLHKIKEDFQAWQHRRLSSDDDERRLGNGRCDVQMIARENLRREKMAARYAYGGNCTKVEKDHKAMNNASAALQQRHDDSAAKVVAAAVSEPQELFMGLEANKGGEHEHGCHGPHGTSLSEKLLFAAPATTRIAILRPTGTRGGAALFGTPAKVKRGGGGGRGMEEFLTEVKERLKSEMKVTGAAGSDDGTTKRQTAAGRAMVRQIKDTVMVKVDIGKRLYTRSESFRVFRGDRKRATKSPENRMLKSVIVPRAEACWSPEKTKRGITASSPVTSRGRTDRALLTDQQSCNGAGGAVAVGSPRALIRSFSAPARSLGISRALAGDTSCEGAEVRSRSFSLLRGTTPLPSLRHSLSLGGKLLTMMMQFSKNKKPSSSSSSPQQSSSGRGDCFAELSPKCSSEFDAQVSESSSCCQSNAAADAESDPDKAYVREVLVTAGLRHGNGGGSDDDTAIGRTDDSMARRPIIGDDGSDEAEDSYYYYYSSRRSDKNAGEEDDDGRDGRRHRRMLFNLTNEALQAGGRSRSQWVGDESGGVSPSSEVADDVWRQGVQATENSATTQMTVDGMVECEVVRTPWLEVVQLQEDVSAVGRKIERAILDQLVAEVAREVFV